MRSNLRTRLQNLTQIGNSSLNVQGNLKAAPALPPPTNTPSPTPSDTPVATVTQTPTPSCTETPTPLPTNTPTDTPICTATPTETDITTPVPTNTPNPTNTLPPTPPPSLTPNPTNTLPPTPPPSATTNIAPPPTETPTPTNTGTETPTPTNSQTPTPTPTNTQTPTPTNMQTPIYIFSSAAYVSGITGPDAIYLGSNSPYNLRFYSMVSGSLSSVSFQTFMADKLSRTDRIISYTNHICNDKLTTTYTNIGNPANGSQTAASTWMILAHPVGSPTSVVKEIQDVTVPTSPVTYSVNPIVITNADYGKTSTQSLGTCTYNGVDYRIYSMVYSAAAATGSVLNRSFKVSTCL